METDLTPSQIIRRMDSAFESVPYPGDDGLLAQDCRAGGRLRDGLRGRPPGAVSDDLVEQYHDGLALLSPEARRYYLPAWARTALRRPASNVAEFVLYTLAGDLRWQLEGGFTRDQRGAVMDFLAFLPRRMDRIFHEQTAAALVRWRSLVPLRRFGWQRGEATDLPVGQMNRFPQSDIPAHFERLELPIHPEQLERLEHRGGIAPAFQRIFG